MCPAKKPAGQIIQNFYLFKRFKQLYISTFFKRGKFHQKHLNVFDGIILSRSCQPVFLSLKHYILLCFYNFPWEPFT